MLCRSVRPELVEASLGELDVGLGLGAKMVGVARLAGHARCRRVARDPAKVGGAEVDRGNLPNLPRPLVVGVVEVHVVGRAEEVAGENAVGLGDGAVLAAFLIRPHKAATRNHLDVPAEEGHGLLRRRMTKDETVASAGSGIELA